MLADAHNIKERRPLELTAQELEAVHPGETEAVLLPYQQRWVQDQSTVKATEKSRRTGLTWAEASDDVLIAATEGRGGSDVLYIGYELEMTREYITTCAYWVKQFGAAVSGMEECLVEDEDKDIKAFRIEFASGHKILALSSTPRNLRGRQGVVVIDEAAFHDDLKALLKAAMALLMWGGRVRIISTHNGDSNYFNELIQDIRAGKKPYSLHRTTFDDAIRQGLCRRIFMVRGQEWTPEAEAAWRAGIVASYGDAADEELHCIPAQGGGVYLSRALIEGCMDAHVDVLRWKPPAPDFVDWPEDRRVRECLAWCAAELAPRLALLPTGQRHYLGEDFGRSGDLTVIWPLSQLQHLVLWTPFIVELRNAPFKTQEQIVFYLCDRLPRFSGGALDARGNGQYLAEVARQRYGAETIAEVMLSEPWYREHMPKLKARLEDRELVLPKDADVLDDLRCLRMIKGVARVPDVRAKDDTGKRHGDAAIALALAVFAVNTLTGGAPPAVTTFGQGEAERMLAGY